MSVSETTSLSSETLLPFWLTGSVEPTVETEVAPASPPAMAARRLSSNETFPAI